MIWFAAGEGPHIEIAAEEIFTVLGLPFTNSMILGLVGYILLGVLSYLLVRGIQRGSRNRAVATGEWAFEGLLKMTESVLQNKTLSRKVAPLAITIFFVVMFNNWLGILPGVGSITSNGIPIFRGLAADLNFTFALAFVTMVAVQFYAIKQFGVFGNIGRYIYNPFTSPIKFFEGILEMIGEFSRFVALSMRLFGNVFGGEVLLTVIAFLSGWLAFLPLPIFMAFELFIGALQAFVFYMLTIIFISLAVSHEDHGDDKAHAETASGNSERLTPVNT